jgi:hypothetical protein
VIDPEEPVSRVKGRGIRVRTGEATPAADAGGTSGIAIPPGRASRAAAVDARRITPAAGSSSKTPWARTFWPRIPATGTQARSLKRLRSTATSPTSR